MPLVSADTGHKLGKKASWVGQFRRLDQWHLQNNWYSRLLVGSILTNVVEFRISLARVTG